MSAPEDLFDTVRQAVTHVVDLIQDALLAPARRRRAARAALGEQLGLEEVMAGDLHLTGRLGGLPVRISTSHDGSDGDLRTVCQVRLRAALPRELRLAPSPRWWPLRGRRHGALEGPAPVLALLFPASRRARLDEIRRHGALSFTGDLVRAQAKGDMVELEEWLRAVLQLARHLDEGWASRDLELALLGFAREVPSRWLGEVHGIHVAIDEASSGGTYATVVHAAVTPALPLATRVVRRGPEHAAEPGLGDLILDRLVAVTTSDRQIASRRLCADAARGPLLEVVHGHPGSSVDSGWVHLHVGQSVCGITPAVHLAVELALALGRNP